MRPFLPPVVIPVINELKTSSSPLRSTASQSLAQILNTQGEKGRTAVIGKLVELFWFGCEEEDSQKGEVLKLAFIEAIKAASSVAPDVIRQFSKEIAPLVTVCRADNASSSILPKLAKLCWEEMGVGSIRSFLREIATSVAKLATLSNFDSKRQAATAVRLCAEEAGSDCSTYLFILNLICLYLIILYYSIQNLWLLFFYFIRSSSWSYLERKRRIFERYNLFNKTFLKYIFIKAIGSLSVACSDVLNGVERVVPIAGETLIAPPTRKDLFQIILKECQKVNAVYSTEATLCLKKMFSKIKISMYVFIDNYLSIQ